MRLRINCEVREDIEKRCQGAETNWNTARARLANSLPLSEDVLALLVNVHIVGGTVDLAKDFLNRFKQEKASNMHRVSDAKAAEDTVAEVRARASGTPETIAAAEGPQEAAETATDPRATATGRGRLKMLVLVQTWLKRAQVRACCWAWT